MMKLPISDFEWMSEDEIKDFDILTKELDGDTGYILECDLHYPKKLHKKHANLPLAPEVVQIGYDNLSPYAKNALLESDGQKRYKDVKLTATFHDRENYVVHGKNLKLYLELGMKLKSIKRILKFKQSTFIAKYIQKCTHARQNAPTKFEISQFKKLVSKNNLPGMGFEPMNLKVSNLKFDALDHSANLTIFYFFRLIVYMGKRCKMYAIT